MLHSPMGVDARHRGCRPEPSGRLDPRPVDGAHAPSRRDTDPLHGQHLHL